MQQSLSEFNHTARFMRPRTRSCQLGIRMALRESNPALWFMCNFHVSPWVRFVVSLVVERIEEHRIRRLSSAVINCLRCTAHNVFVECHFYCCFWGCCCCCSSSSSSLSPSSSQPDYEPQMWCLKYNSWIVIQQSGLPSVWGGGENGWYSSILCVSGRRSHPVLDGLNLKTHFFKLGWAQSEAPRTSTASSTFIPGS